MHCVNLALILYCLYDSMANHSQSLLCYFFHELLSGIVIIYKTYAWWMVILLCTLYNLWLNYQLYCLLSVMRFYSPDPFLFMRALTSHKDKTIWLFKCQLNHNSEPLCCLTIFCPDTSNLINELLEHT
jgi:hypothetical protein